MESDKKKVIVYGLGKDFEDFRNTIEREYNVLGYCDTDVKKSELYQPFFRVDEIQNNNDNILITSTKYFDEIRETLIEKGIDENKIEENGLKKLITVPVIVVKMHGGFGNAMFCYAFGQMLKRFDPFIPVYFDVSYYELESSRCFINILPNINKLFDFSFSVADTETILRAKRQGDTKQRESLVYEEKYLKVGQGFFNGYWQSSKYFNGIEDKLRAEFKFNEEFMSAEQTKLLRKIRQNESAAVWFRRGDYLTGKPAESFGNICTQEYYDKAMDYIKSKYENVQFFIFSNDSEYIAENYSEHNLMIYDDDTSDIKDYDMYLMASCKHLIIANSTFSWWAAWLHGNEGIVIAPKRWFNGREDTDIWEENWIKM